MSKKERVVDISSSLEEYSPKELGGKGYSLMQLKKIGMPICRGLIIPTSVFDRFISENNLNEKIKNLLLNLNEKNINQKSHQIENLILKSNFPDDAYREILEVLEKQGILNSNFIVRSSANIEDTEKFSFAGLFETIIDVKKEELKSAILKVYSSLYLPRALKYIYDKQLRVADIKMAVIIQEFIDTDFAGVAFTKDPTSEKDNIIIEFVEGLGEEFVAGRKDPSRAVFDKKSLKVIDYRKSPYNKEIDLKILKEVAKKSKKIEEYFKKPMDIEWGVKGSRIFIFQARPITTFGFVHEKEVNIDKKEYSVIKGIPGGPGIFSGKVKIVRKRDELKNLNKTDVLVCKITYDNYMPEMLKAGAIVTELGGLTSHAAIIAREYKIPCVVGAVGVMETLKDGEEVVVNGYEGEIYYKGKKRVPQQSIEDSGLDFVPERLIPYAIKFEKKKVSLKKSDLSQLLKSPYTHILIEELNTQVLVHKPDTIKLSKSKIAELSKYFGKPVFVLGPEKFETFISVEYVAKQNKEYERTLKKLPKIVNDPEKIENFARECIKKDLEYLRKAKKLLRKKEISIKELEKVLDLINTSGVYFTLVNTLLATGYGIDYVRKEYSKIEKDVGVPFKEFVFYIDTNPEKVKEIKNKIKKDKKKLEVLDKIIKIYKKVALWKIKSDNLDEWDERKVLWDEAVKRFYKITGRDIKEFLNGQYGSGHKLKEFFKSLKK